MRKLLAPFVLGLLCNVSCQPMPAETDDAALEEELCSGIDEANYGTIAAELQVLVTNIYAGDELADASVSEQSLAKWGGNCAFKFLVVRPESRAWTVGAPPPIRRPTRRCYMSAGDPSTFLGCVSIDGDG